MAQFESVIDPDQRICDAHHHLWLYPTSRYLKDEFINEVEQSGHKIVSTIYAECLQHYDESAETKLQPVGETQYVDEVYSQTTNVIGIGRGIVGFADLLLGEAVEPVLQAHIAASRNFCGIRYSSAWHESELLHNAYTNPFEKLLLDSKFQKGFAVLSKLDLSFDAWVYFTQLDEVVALASRFPETRIVVDHAGGLLGIGPYAGKQEEVFKAWKRKLSGLAEYQNVYVKFGGLGMKSVGHDWHRWDNKPTGEMLANAFQPYFDVCIEVFGPGRIIFESNFPMDKPSYSYRSIWNAFKLLMKDLSGTEKDCMLYGNAFDFYKLEKD